MATAPMPTYYVNHGGGPWPYIRDSPFRRMFDELERSLVRMRAELAGKPTAVLMVTGHWEEQIFTLSSGDRPSMIYDFGGFPDYLYDIHYRAPGSPVLAKRVETLLTAAGLPVALDPVRGFDHGTYSVMQPLYPEATMPVVQLSLKTGMDPATHLALGRALAPLRDEGVLILGSGSSYHNLREVGPRAWEPSHRFDAWLGETLIDASADERIARLLCWDAAPSARAAHPYEDHLLPLMVVVGAAGDAPGSRSHHEADFAGGVAISSFRFGTPPAPAEGHAQ